MPLDAQPLAGPDISHQTVASPGAGARRILRDPRLVGLALCLGLVLAAVRAGAQPYAYIPSLSGANYEPGEVSVIDTRTHTVVATIPVGPSPWSVAISPDGRRVYVGSVSAAGSGVSAIDARTNRVVQTGLVGYVPSAMVVSRDGTRLYVADGPAIHEVNAQTLSVLRSVATGQNVTRMVMSTEGSVLFVTMGEGLSVILLRTLELGGRLQSIFNRSVAVLDPANGTLYAAADGYLRAIRLLDYRFRWAIQIPGLHAESVALSPDGRRLYIGDGEKGQVVVVDLVARRLLKPLRTTAQIRGLSLTPDGSALYVLLPVRDRVTVFDTATGKVLAKIPVANYPRAVGTFIGPAQIGGSPSLPAESRNR